MTYKSNEPLTSASVDLFLKLANDADNWNGTPLLDIDKKERGNLSQLKKQGLLTTFIEEGNNWVFFTKLGVEFATHFDIELKVC